MKYTKIAKIAKGCSSYIWTIRDPNNKVFILKEVREKSNRKNLAEREGKMLTLANSVGIGPKVKEVNYDENFVIMEFVNGPKLFDFIHSKEFDNISKKELYYFVKELTRQCLVLDSIGLRHTQLQVGKNILVTKKNGKYFPIIIDFEKASIDPEKKKEKNFGQLAGFLLYNPHGKIAKKIREKLEIKL